MVQRRRFHHLAAFAGAIIAIVVVLALAGQVALASIVGIIGIVLIGAAVPFLAIEQDEHRH